MDDGGGGAVSPLVPPASAALPADRPNLSRPSRAAPARKSRKRRAAADSLSDGAAASFSDGTVGRAATVMGAETQTAVAAAPPWLDAQASSACSSAGSSRSGRFVAKVPRSGRGASTAPEAASSVAVGAGGTRAVASAEADLGGSPAPAPRSHGVPVRNGLVAAKRQNGRNGKISHGQQDFDTPNGEGPMPGGGSTNRSSAAAVATAVSKASGLMTMEDTAAPSPVVSRTGPGAQSDGLNHLPGPRNATAPAVEDVIAPPRFRGVGFDGVEPLNTALTGCPVSGGSLQTNQIIFEGVAGGVDDARRPRGQQYGDRNATREGFVWVAEDYDPPGAGDDDDAGSEDEGSGEGAVGRLAAPHADGLTSDDFQCNICWELLARPVTLVCGHTACESCMAKYLRTQAQAQAHIGNIRANRIACPAGCQRMIPLVLPEVTTMIQKLLTRGFPVAYRDRLLETEPERALVSQVRRVAEDAAAESRRRRRRHHQLGGGAAGIAGLAGAGGGGQAGGREVMGFGNVPPGFMQGFHGQQNAARFRLDVAVPQRDIPPTVARWYKRMGLGLFACLCVSWQQSSGGDRLLHPSLFFWRDAPVAGDVARSTRQRGVEWVFDAASVGVCANNKVDSDEDICGGGEGDEGEGEAGDGRVKDDEWLFSMEMNPQEFIAHNHWTALRSFYPSNSPWSSALFLYLKDPVLVLPTSEQQRQTPPMSATPPAANGTSLWELLVRPPPSSSVPTAPALAPVSTADTNAAGSTAETEVGGTRRTVSSLVALLTKPPWLFVSFLLGLGEHAETTSSTTAGAGQHQRRLFLEFYGPIVGFFDSFGLPAWLSELSTVMATQLCPLLAVAPMLRLSPHRVAGTGSIDDLVAIDFSLDMVIYAVFSLLLTTLTTWRAAWKAVRGEPLGKACKGLFVATLMHFARELLVIKVVSPVIEHLLFYYVLHWQTRYLLTWASLSARITIMRLLATLRMALVMASPFMPRGMLHTLETLWCHLFTYLLLGTRFFNTFFVGDPVGRRQHGGERVERPPRRLVHPLRDAQAVAEAPLGGPAEPLLNALPPAQPVGGPAAAAAVAPVLAPARGIGNVGNPAVAAPPGNPGGGYGGIANGAIAAVDPARQARLDLDAHRARVVAAGAAPVPIEGLAAEAAPAAPIRGGNDDVNLGPLDAGGRGWPWPIHGRGLALPVGDGGAPLVGVADPVRARLGGNVGGGLQRQRRRQQQQQQQQQGGAPHNARVVAEGARNAVVNQPLPDPLQQVHPRVAVGGDRDRGMGLVLALAAVGQDEEVVPPVVQGENMGVAGAREVAGDEHQ